MRSVALVLLGGVEPVFDHVKDTIEAAVNLFYDEVDLDVVKMDTPSDAYDAERGQVDAVKLIRSLAEVPRLDDLDLTIALLSEDMYFAKMNFIFGLADIRGRKVVVSTYRLERDYSTLNMAPVDDLRERVFKELLHEMGHVFGFEHCPDKSCVMSFSPTLLDVDEKLPLFCKVCRARLKIR